MSDCRVIQFPSHRVKESDPVNRTCECGSQWFVAAVVFNNEMTKINGWHVSGGEDPMGPQCYQCGRLAYPE
jgi:hypothetical protein